MTSVSAVGEVSVEMTEVEEGMHVLSDEWLSAAVSLCLPLTEGGVRMTESVEVETARWIKAAMRSIIFVPPGFIDVERSPVEP